MALFMAPYMAPYTECSVYGVLRKSRYGAVNDTLNSVFRPKIAVYSAAYGMNSSVYGVLKGKYGAVYGYTKLCI